MANLEKFKEAARKFEQKEQWAKAVEQYVKAIEVFEAAPEPDESELTLYNKVGDLYQKINDAPNAVVYYERAVDKNADIGLVNQGIALCNKILRISPGRAQIYLKLGMLFAKKGFMAEAKTNLLEYADRMQKAGQLESAFAALKKFAEMSPEAGGEIWGVLAAQARASARTPEQKEATERLLGEFEAKDRGEKRKSRASRHMLTGEDLPPEPPRKKGELIFLDVDEAPAPRKSAPAMPAPAPAAAKPAPPPPPPPPEPEPEPEPERLEIQSSMMPEVEEPAAPAPAADLPLLEIEPTAMAEPPAAAAPAGGDLGLEPTSLGFEPTSFGEAPIIPPEPEPEPEPAEAGGSDLLDLDIGEIETGAPSAEAAPEPTAGLPLVDVGGEPEPATAPAAEEIPTNELEFLDIGEAPAVPAAPSVADLEARVAADAEDWEAHRLLGEALLEQGDRERGLSELDTASDGYDQAGDLDVASTIVEELLKVDPNSLKYQQKRVELAYRQGDKARLVDAYVELADALLRSNEVEKAIAVYQRVIEHDPTNVRAKTQLETLAPAAPPPPPAPKRRSSVHLPRPSEHPSAPAAPSAPPAAAAAAGDYVDLGAMLLDEEEVAAPKDTRMRIGDEEPSGDEQKDFQQMLSAFKKGIEANVAEEDFQSHYDLGVAYKEMGLVDEAIAEFQKALRAPEGKLKSSEALGGCFFEKGQFAVAETIMRRGLDMPAHDDRERIGLLYWLGRACEEQGKTQDALASYNRVFAVDIRFADIGARVKALGGAQ